MTYVIFFGVGIPVFALVFTCTAYGLGIFFSSFRPEEGSIASVYRGFLAIAAIYLLVVIIAPPGPLGLVFYVAVMTAAYRFVFDADWPQAVVIGLVGGIIGRIALLALLELGLRLN